VETTYPGTRIALHIGNTRDVSLSVARLTVDIGFIEGPNHQDDVRALAWMDDELVIVASPAHPLAVQARKRKLSARVLQNAEWLLREPGSGTREAVEQALLPHLGQLHSATELGSAESIRHAAAEGMGLACLSTRVVADFVASGRLQVLRTTLPPLTRSFSIVMHRQKFVTPALERLLVHCRAQPARQRRR